MPASQAPPDRGHAHRAVPAVEVQPAEPAPATPKTPSLPSAKEFWERNFENASSVPWKVFAPAFREAVCAPLGLREEDLHTIRALLGAHSSDGALVRRDAALAAFGPGFGPTCRALAASTQFRGFSPSAAAGRPSTPSPSLDGPPSPFGSPRPPTARDPVESGANPSANENFRRIEKLAAGDSLDQLRDSISLEAIVESLESTDTQAQAAKTLGALAQADPMFQSSVALIGGIPPLVRMLERPSSSKESASGERAAATARECALFALTNLARRNGPNQRAVAGAGAVPLLSAALRDGPERERLLAAKLAGYLAEHPDNHPLLRARDGGAGASCAQRVARLLLSKDRSARDVAGAAMFYITLNPVTCEHLLSADSADLHLVRVFAGMLAGGDDPVVCNSIAVLQHLAAHGATRERLLADAVAANITKPVASLVKHRPPRISAYGVQLLVSLLSQAAALAAFQSQQPPPAAGPAPPSVPPAPLPPRGACHSACASCDGGAITRAFGRLLGLPASLADHTHLPESPSLPSHVHPRRRSASNSGSAAPTAPDGAAQRSALVAGFVEAGGHAALLRHLDSVAGRADRRFCAGAVALLRLLCAASDEAAGALCREGAEATLRSLLQGGTLPPEERAQASLLVAGLSSAAAVVAALPD